MMFRIFASTAVLCVAMAFAQPADGQIAGRITDKSGGPLPGARVTVTNSDQTREVVTDIDGRFTLPSLSIGTYRVVAELAGFSSASGDIRLTSSSPRAQLAWTLDVGCLTEDLPVLLGARQAAPRVDAILHIRVIAAERPVLISVRPECPGRLAREYSVDVLGKASPRGGSSSGRTQIFMPPEDARLERGHEYIALLWHDRSATRDLVLPIVSGAVASPGTRELNGMPVDEALKVLGTWSQERRQ